MDPVDHGKRKMAEKNMPHRGRGRSAVVGSSRDAPQGRGGWETHDQYIEDEKKVGEAWAHHRFHS
jgi:hypothetical protein